MIDAKFNDNSKVGIAAHILGISTLLTGMGVVGVVLLSLLSLVFWLPLTLWKAWIAVQIWNWFAVPVGLPTVSIWVFVGAMLLFNTLGLYRHSNDFMKPTEVPDPNAPPKKKPNLFTAMFNLYVQPALCLFLGYVVKTWIM